VAAVSITVMNLRALFFDHRSNLPLMCQLYDQTQHTVLVQ